LIVGVATAVVREIRSGLAPDLRRTAALSAAVLLALQLLAGYWTVLYTVWIVPLLAASLLSTPARAAAESTERVVGEGRRRLGLAAPAAAGLS
jgi:hypothetical protein